MAVGCTGKGKGCPLRSAKSYQFTKARAGKALASLFTRKVRKRRRPVHLKVGAKLTISVSSPTAIGRRFTYTVQRKAVRKTSGCLAPGSARALAC